MIEQRKEYRNKEERNRSGLTKDKFIRLAKYGSFRYEIINEKVWLYYSDIRHKMDIPDFSVIKKIDRMNVERRSIETPLGQILAYLVNEAGMREVIAYSKRKIYEKEDFMNFVSYKIKIIEKEIKEYGKNNF